MKTTLTHYQNFAVWYLKTPRACGDLSAYTSGWFTIEITMFGRS